MNIADTVHRDDRFTEGLTRKVLWVINHAGKLASVRVNLHIHSWTRSLHPSQLFFFSLCLAFFFSSAVHSSLLTGALCADGTLCWRAGTWNRRVMRHRGQRAVSADGLQFWRSQQSASQATTSSPRTPDGLSKVFLKESSQRHGRMHFNYPTETL